MQVQTAITKESARSRVLEFAKLDENAITRTQIEIKDGIVYMRAKRRTYVFT